MTETFELNSSYSTTRQVLNADPKYMVEVIKVSNKPEDKFETVLFLPANQDRKGVGGLRSQGYFKISENLFQSRRYDKRLDQSKPEKPLITIVTVVFNGELFLEETIQSVLNQTYENVEYIIIDGGSTDGTLDIIRKYEHAVDYWVSESDKGMYDALNKGLALAQGDILNFINSDDYFYDCEVLASMSEYFLKNGAQCAYGKSEYVNLHGGKIFEKKPLGYKKRYLKTLGLFFSQPTFFWTKKLMKRNGLIDLKYRVSADYDFIANMMVDSNKVIRSRRIISCFRVFGESFGDKNSKLAEKEFSLINKKYEFPFSKIISLYDRLVQKVYQYFG